MQRVLWTNPDTGTSGSMNNLKTISDYTDALDRAINLAGPDGLAWSETQKEASEYEVID